MYNLVLGLLLRAQSKTTVITRWMDSLRAAQRRARDAGVTPPFTSRVVNSMLSTTLVRTRAVSRTRRHARARAWTRAWTRARNRAPNPPRPHACAPRRVLMLC